MNHRQTTIALLSAACFVVASLSSYAGGTGLGPGSLETAAEKEITRRQNAIARAEDALNRGDAALASNNIENAYNAYKEAVNLVPDGSATSGLRARALSRYSSTSVRFGEYLVSQGQYARAEVVVREVLEPRYNPNYRPAAVFLTRLEQPDYFNKTITPEFAEQRDEVSQLLTDANGYFDSGRYDLASKKYQQVLAVDKYNTSAMRGLEQIELGKQRYYDSAYNETRSRMLWQVDKAWEQPRRHFVEARSTDSTALQEERRGTEAMTARLNRIILPSLSIQDKSIRQAVDELKRLSRQYDTGAGEGSSRGINIVLKSNPAAASAPSTTPEATAGEAAESVTPAIPETINVRLTNIPLYEALRYVATLSGLKVKVEPFAVSLVPLSESTDILEQREFKVPPGFISGTASPDSDVATAGGATSKSTNPQLAGRITARKFLEEQGVQFPPGASANFVPGSSRLVVRNTADNLNLIESLVSAAMGEQPTQVEIESKFVEISQDNLKELGFDWTLGPFSIDGSGVYAGGGDRLSASGNDFPFTIPGTGQPVGGDTVTSGLRSGTGVGGAITPNSLNALLLRNLGLASGGPAPGIFAVSGIFTNPQFQVVIRALNQKKGVDLMAAPKVTTQSGKKAVISINRIFPYPQEYQPPQIPTQSGVSQGGGGGGAGIGSALANTTLPIVTPSFPTDFTTRNLGVTLEVEPQVGADGYTIELTLSPEVVDFDGFVNYGSPIYTLRMPTTILTAPIPGIAGSLASTLVGTPTRELLTENVINQPIFSTRKVTTNVSIWDGQTVALGGLIREDVQKVSDKVPILGDVPFAGALFRSDSEQKIKKNLIIFVTARLMDAAGQPLRPEGDSDQEEIVEPLGLPQDLKKPTMTAKGFRGK